MTEVYATRQPIFDRGQTVVGYELLFRDGQATGVTVADRAAAAASLVLSSLTELGLERVLGARSAWIKLPFASITQSLVDLLPERTVIEIPSPDVVDDRLLDTFAGLRRAGKRVALDGFRFTPAAEPLLRLVDVVRLDLGELGRTELAREVARLEGSDVTRLAVAVETAADQAFCAQSGCELFQGGFFSRPELIHGTRIDANRLAVIELLATLQDPNAELADVQRTIALDVGLSVRLLRYINSAYFGLRQPVRSIGQALALLGLDHLRPWVALTLFASVEGKPSELTVTALVRARFCELAAQYTDEIDSGELFTVGLFSVIDALLDAPMEQALAGVPLTQSARDALIAHTGTMGQLLQCVIDLEEAEFERAETILSHAGRVYTTAVTWADAAARPLFEH